MRALEKRYRRELFLAMAAYVVVLLLIYPLARQVEAPFWRALVALAPVLPFAAALRAIIRHVRDSDEFQRRLHLEALAISSVVVSLLSTTAAFLVAAKVITLDGTVLFWVFPALAGLFGALRCWNARRYGRE